MRGPGRQDVERQVALEALRRPQAEQEADPAAPVVADQLHPLEPERVEDGEHVVGQVLLLVAVARRVGPAEAAQVERDHPVAVGQRRHQVAPLVPVLRPAVQAEDDVVAGRPLRRVEVDARAPRTVRWVTPSTCGAARLTSQARASRPPLSQRSAAAAAWRKSSSISLHRLDVAGDHFRPRASRDARAASSARCR